MGAAGACDIGARGRRDVAAAGVCPFEPPALALQAKGAKLVSVTCCGGCKMDALCDMAIRLPLERELCPFDLAPVTSTAIQMLFGDTVAIALMQVGPGVYVLST
jgi:hypothetical protein